MLDDGHRDEAEVFPYRVLSRLARRLDAAPLSVEAEAVVGALHRAIDDSAEAEVDPSMGAAGVEHAGQAVRAAEEHPRLTEAIDAEGPLPPELLRLGDDVPMVSGRALLITSALRAEGDEAS
jgi:hypothetical protein